jgi:O-antigen ligase
VTVGHVVPTGHGHIRVLGHEWNLVRGPRVHTWLSAVGTVAENPFLGVGYGDVVARTPGKELSPWLTGRLDPFADAGPLVAEAHNTWLNVAGQTGLLGLAAFLWLLVQVSRRLSARPLPMPSPVANLPTAVVAGAAGALLFHGFFAGAEEARHLCALLSLGTAAEIVRRTAEGLNRGTTPVSSERHRPSR